MILLVERDRAISKKLCDMLNRERIIVVDSPQAAMEAIVRHRKKLDAIVANINLFLGVLKSDILTRLCARLYLTVPQLIIVYSESDGGKLPKSEKLEYRCSFLKYDVKDMNFPEKYIRAIKSIYPEVVANIIVANEVWLSTPGKQEAIDVSKWFTDQGFLEVASQITPAPGKVEKKEESADNAEYKELYDELNKKYSVLKQKYDDLIRQMKKLTGSG